MNILYIILLWLMSSTTTTIKISCQNVAELFNIVCTNKKTTVDYASSYTPEKCNDLIDLFNIYCVEKNKPKVPDSTPINDFIAKFKKI